MSVAPASNTASILAWDKTQTLPKPQPQAPKPNRALVLAAVVAVILLVAMGTWRYSHARASEPLVRVVAAGQDIPAGVKLGLMSLHYLEIPKTFVTPDMVPSFSCVTDCITRTYISIGEPIKMPMLLPKNAGLSSSLENDERAITLDLNSEAIVDHSILPDDLVDVLAVITNKDGKKYTKTIGQAVRVLISTSKQQFLARNLSSAIGKGITLAVTPDLAEAITEASEIGKLRLVLRNRLSHVSQNLSGVGPSELLPASAELDSRNNLPLPPVALESVPQAPAIPASPTDKFVAQPLQWLVEVISGSHKETYGVPEN